MKQVTSIKNFPTLLLILIFPLTVILTSCGGEDGENVFEIPGVDGPHVTLHEDNVLISAVFENIYLEGGLRYDIPKYDNSYMELSPDFQSGGTLMAISLSLQDVLNGSLTKLDPQRLPGGRNLPGVASGALPAVAFSVEKFHNMAVYVGPSVFGVFIPVKLNMPAAMMTFRYHADSKRAGNISLIGEDENGENSGFLLLLDMSKKTKRALNYVADQYAEEEEDDDWW